MGIPPAMLGRLPMLKGRFPIIGPLMANGASGLLAPNPNGMAELTGTVGMLLGTPNGMMGWLLTAKGLLNGLLGARLGAAMLGELLAMGRLLAVMIEVPGGLPDMLLASSETAGSSISLADSGSMSREVM